MLVKTTTVRSWSRSISSTRRDSSSTVRTVMVLIGPWSNVTRQYCGVSRSTDRCGSPLVVIGFLRVGLRDGRVELCRHPRPARARDRTRWGGLIACRAGLSQVDGLEPLVGGQGLEAELHAESAGFDHGCR